MGTNSDQRSVALGGVFAAGAFALFTVAATVFTGNHQNFGMVCASVIAGLLFMIASALCLAAAMPGDFYVGGYAPRDLIAYAPEPIWMQIYTIEDFQRRIDANREALAYSATLIKSAIRFAFFGIASGTVIASAGIVAGLHLGLLPQGPTLAMAAIAGVTLALLAALGAEATRL